MCGLVGIFGKINTSNLDTIFENLLQVGVVRGPDSTGVAILSNARSRTKIFKGAIPPSLLIKDSKYVKAKSGENLLMMGHNRAATVGEIKNSNAHPFRAKHITLAHNGTIFQSADILKGTKFETDSETIANSIADIGIEKTWPKLEGATAITYWDEKIKRFYMASDGKRPLFFTYSEDKSVLFYASEIWMLKSILSRNKEKIIKPEKEGDPDVWYPSSDILYSFYLNKDGEVVFETKKLNPFTYTYIYGGREHNINTYGEDWWFKQKEKIEQKKENKLSKSIIPFNKDTKNYYDDYKHLLARETLDIKTFQNTYKICFMCRESVHDAYYTTVILDRTIAICRECVHVSYVNGIPLTKGAYI